MGTYQRWSTYAFSFIMEKRGFFKPQIWVDENELRFGLIKRKDRKHVSSKLYTVYHAKFIEMLLANFDMDFFQVTATAMKTEPDDF